MIDILLEYDGQKGDVGFITLPYIPRQGERIAIFKGGKENEWETLRVKNVTYNFKYEKFDSVELFVEIL